MSVVGLIGVLVFFAGARLLWQGRHEIIFWLTEFFRILRGEFTRRDAAVGEAGSLILSSPVAAPGSAPRNRGTLRLVGGLALIFIGQVLLLLDLVFLG